MVYTALEISLKKKPGGLVKRQTPGLSPHSSSLTGLLQDDTNQNPEKPSQHARQHVLRLAQLLLGFWPV